MTDRRLRIVGIAGSLRAASYNRRALDVASALAPAEIELVPTEIGELPHYDGDADTTPGHPRVVQLKQAIAESDGVLIVTPEYNYGIPGVLKNAIDWASRPGYKSVLAYKPVAMFGVSTSPVGTARAQGQLKQVLLGVLAHIWPYPEVTIGQAAEKFTADGDLLDERAREAIRGLLAGFESFVRRLV